MVAFGAFGWGFAIGAIVALGAYGAFFVVVGEIVATCALDALRTVAFNTVCAIGIIGVGTIYTGAVGYTFKLIVEAILIADVTFIRSTEGTKFTVFLFTFRGG